MDRHQVSSLSRTAPAGGCVLHSYTTKERNLRCKLPVSPPALHIQIYAGGVASSMQDQRIKDYPVAGHSSHGSHSQADVVTMEIDQVLKQEPYL